jgi:hypothetical protein
VSTSLVLVLKTAKSIVINSNTPHQCQLSTEAASAGARKERRRCCRRRSVGGPRGSWPRQGVGRPLVGTRRRGGLPGARAAPPAGGGWALACEREGSGLGPQQWRRRVDGDGCARGSEHLHVVLWHPNISFLIIEGDAVSDPGMNIIISYLF